MVQYINNFKNDVIYSFEQIAEVGKGIGQRIITFDRSEEKFVETPEDHPAAQLKGRDRMITHELARVALGTLLVAFSACQCIMHPGGMNYFMTALFGFGTLVALKEVAIQSIARQKEKKRFKIEEETQDTQYSFQELMDELTQSINRSFDDMYRSLNQLLAISKNNDTTENVES